MERTNTNNYVHKITTMSSYKQREYSSSSLTYAMGNIRKPNYKRLKRTFNLNNNTSSFLENYAFIKYFTNSFKNFDLTVSDGSKVYE